MAVSILLPPSRSEHRISLVADAPVTITVARWHLGAQTDSRGMSDCPRQRTHLLMLSSMSLRRWAQRRMSLVRFATCAPSPQSIPTFPVDYHRNMS